MRIGFIGFGEAAYYISLGLKEEGAGDFIAYDKLGADPVLGKQVAARAKEAQAVMVSSAAQVADSSDVIISAVPSSYALDVCQEIMSVLRNGQIYADVSASTPAVKQTIWEAVKETGVLFADAAMLGSLPKDRHQVPITASGNGAAAFKEVMTPFGMRITTVGEQAGDASAIKLIRSIYMKGIAALMIEMLQAADCCGVSQRVLTSVSASMDHIPFTEHLNRLVTGTAVHWHRRAAELSGSSDMLRECGIDPIMTMAAKKSMEALEAYHFAERYREQKPGGWEDIIRVMREPEEEG